MTTIDEAMTIALEHARAASAAGEVPVGAVVIDADGTVLGTGENTREREGDPTGHAEVNALRAAAEALGKWHLEGATLIVTMEPCVMCAGALLAARISKVVFGAWDEKAGAAGSLYDVVRDRRLPVRAEVIGGVREAEAVEILRDFFEARR